MNSKKRFDVLSLNVKYNIGTKYLIRLDDACPTMDFEKWNRFEALLDYYSIKPIVAVIPNNENESLMIGQFDMDFWHRVRSWHSKGWSIALHGYDHVFINKTWESIIPLNDYTEFSGIDISTQRKKIRMGIDAFRKEGIEPTVWVAPAHSFDKNTLKALKFESDIVVISDGFSYRPYNRFGFSWIPQQLWQFEEKKSGTWTACFHPNTCSSDNFDKLALFLERNSTNFFSVDDLLPIHNKMALDDFFYFHYFFLKRKIKCLLKK